MPKLDELNAAKKIEISTIFGNLIAELSGDPAYPGINICVERADEEGNKYNKQLALVEATPNIPTEGEHSLRLLVWNGDEEDFTDSFTFLETRSDEDSDEYATSQR